MTLVVRGPWLIVECWRQNVLEEGSVRRRTFFARWVGRAAGFGLMVCTLVPPRLIVPLNGL